MISKEKPNRQQVVVAWRTPRLRFARLLPLVLFAGGGGLGLFFWRRVSLPFENPLGIRSPMAAAGLNPNNDLSRFGLLIGLQVAILFAGYLICPRRLRAVCFGTASRRADSSDRAIGRPVGFVILLAIAAALSGIFSLGLTTFTAGDPQLDTFHEGESLGPASLFLRGQVPYRDILLTHGPFQDPLRSVLAFRLFGRSIGAQRTVQSLLKVLEFALLGVLVVVLLPGDALAAMLTLAVMLALYVSPVTNGSGQHLGCLAQHLQRDVTTYLFVIAILALYRQRRAGRAGLLAAWTVPFVAVGAFAYSADCGARLTLACLVLEGTIIAVYPGRAWLAAAAFSLLGLGCGGALLGWSIQWYWADWARCTFLELPRF